MLSTTLALGLTVVASAVTASPAYPQYSVPLPIMPNASPSKTIDVDGQSIDFYDIHIQPFEKQVYPNLGTASMIGYNGMVPGPTFWIKRYQQTVVRFHNGQPNNCSTHLHGSDTHSPWDGWADDAMMPGQYKDYYYPNDHMARPMWYHDHANHFTATNAYAGLAGIWIIYDEAEAALNLPTGNYDLPLAISDKTFDNNGGLIVPSEEGQNQFGDVVDVNGQPWPYMDTEPRKYRLRIFDMSLSRPWELFIADEQGNWIDFQVIASDGGLFSGPVTTNSIQIAPGERYEIIFDFAPYQNQNLTMGDNMGSGPNGEIRQLSLSNDVMRFAVGSSVSDSTNNGDVPQSLSADIPWPEKTDEVSQTFNFGVGGDARWTINGVDYDDANNRVLARPQVGSTELWEVKYTGGPGVHPVHVHLVTFQIISRTGGSRGLLPYESAGLKDIVLLEPGETATILANFGPWNGIYMFHCHNLIHEDNNMMVAMNVTALEDQGYNATASFPDPADPRFIARYPDSDSDSDAAISATVSFLGGLHAYDTGFTGTVSQTTMSGSNVTMPSTTAVTTGDATGTALTQSEWVTPSANAQGQYGYKNQYNGQNWNENGNNHAQPSQSNNNDHNQNQNQNQNHNNNNNQDWRGNWQGQKHRGPPAGARIVRRSPEVTPAPRFVEAKFAA